MFCIPKWSSATISWYNKYGDYLLIDTHRLFNYLYQNLHIYPDSKVHEANMGPIWGRQDPGGPHVGPMNFVIWVYVLYIHNFVFQ